MANSEMFCLRPQSRPAWDAWIEMMIVDNLPSVGKSRPAWDAWIEIYYERATDGGTSVASRMGRVD